MNIVAGLAGASALLGIVYYLLIAAIPIVLILIYLSLRRQERVQAQQVELLAELLADDD